ncbi:orotidine 5'-phosphate decarboxylase [Gemmatimonadetes bacterium T265]|nr:orotidine 5'-phosphate decarboxylase [Gemmatimonadetes bacterium T265]
MNTGVRAELIVALDRPTLADALTLVDAAGDACRFYKVGLELFTAAGPAAVDAVRARGADVFLDLKLHDIPATVRGAARRAAGLGARLLTVHASGGTAMVRAAVEGAREGGGDGGAPCDILAVTVLTSLDAPSLAAAWGRPDVQPEAEVLRLARLAGEAGAHGVVCSGAEVAAVRATSPALATLVPGLRMPGDSADDQARVVTPAAAAAAGARYLVLGRAVTAARDPRAALERVRASLA